MSNSATAVTNLERRLAWATAYGEAALARADRSAAATYSKIATDARKELRTLTGLVY